jgi:DUF1680 family protein
MIQICKYALGVACVLSFSAGKAQVADQLRPASQVKVGGVVGERLHNSYENRILAQDVDRLVDAFRHRTETTRWQSEFWGKWFTSAVLAYRYDPQPRLKKVLEDAVAGLLSTQSADGYIGNYTDAARLERWDIWGRKYCMLGLLDYYDLTGDKKSLKAAARVADNLEDELARKQKSIVQFGSYRGMAASSVLEPVVLLYTRTGNKKYLAFAEKIVQDWETPEGPMLISKAAEPVGKRFPPVSAQQWYGWEQGQKAYEMMSCYEGLLELYRITGNAAYKKAVEQTWQHIYDMEINIAGSGASAEMWFGGKQLQALPVFHYQETCVTVTWLKLSEQLLRLTGEAKYADAVETSFYNALLGSMSADGARWAKYTPLTGERLPGSEQCGMGLNCCEASGPRGLFNVPFFIATGTPQGAQVNYFAEGAAVVNTPRKQALTLRQHTDYPVSGQIGVEVSLPKPEEMTLGLRIPAWSQRSTLKVNGEEVTGIAPGGYAMVKRQWKTGDRITLELDMRGRVVTQEGTPRYAAIMRGPVVLSRDERLPGTPAPVVAHPVADKDGYIALTPVSNRHKEVWMQYKATFIPESYMDKAVEPVEVQLCDYASAGNGEERSYFRTWMPYLVDPKTLK